MENVPINCEGQARNAIQDEIQMYRQVKVSNHTTERQRYEGHLKNNNHCTFIRNSACNYIKCLHLGKIGIFSTRLTKNYFKIIRFNDFADAHIDQCTGHWKSSSNKK